MKLLANYLFPNHWRVSQATQQTNSVCSKDVSITEKGIGNDTRGPKRQLTVDKASGLKTRQTSVSTTHKHMDTRWPNIIRYGIHQGDSLLLFCTQQHGKGPVRLWVTNQQAAADQPTNRNGGWQVIITVDGNIRNNGNKEKEVLGAGGTTRASAEGKVQSGPSDNVSINSETERVIPADSWHNIGGLCPEEWRPGKKMFYRTRKPPENLRLMITHSSEELCLLWGW